MIRHFNLPYRAPTTRFSLGRFRGLCEFLGYDAKFMVIEVQESISANFASMVAKFSKNALKCL
jgi:hypothetical protein